MSQLSQQNGGSQHHRNHSHHHHQHKQTVAEQTAQLERLTQSSQDFRPAQQQQQQQRQHSPIKMGADQSSQSTVAEGAQVQRKLFGFLYVYAILIVALYATYAAYYFYQHQRHRQQHHQQQLPTLDNHAISIEPSTAKLALAASDSSSNQQQQQQQQFQTELEARLESKIHLLERYIEVIAVDLQETKSRLREREKCDCSISCTFNGTRYSDGSSWQSQCDVCTCRAGRISCAPQKCPATNCDDAVLLPGQCCPTCMKKCKHNDKLYRHGQKFKPTNELAGRLATGSQQAKECRCYDGRIRCEQVQKAAATAAAPASRTVVGAIRAALAANYPNGGSSSSSNSSVPTIGVREPTVPTVPTAPTVPEALASSSSSSSSQETKGKRQGQMTADLSLAPVANSGGANDLASPLSASDRLKSEASRGGRLEEELPLQVQQPASPILEASSSPSSSSSRTASENKQVLGRKNEFMSPPIAANGIGNEPARAGTAAGAAPTNFREAHENS